MTKLLKALAACAALGAATQAVAQDAGAGDTLCATSYSARLVQASAGAGYELPGKATLVLQNLTDTPVHLVGQHENAKTLLASDARMHCERMLNPVPIALSVVRSSDGARLQTISLRDAIGPRLTFIVEETGVTFEDTAPTLRTLGG